MVCRTCDEKKRNGSYHRVVMTVIVESRRRKERPKKI